MSAAATKQKLTTQQTVALLGLAGALLTTAGAVWALVDSLKEQ